LEEKNTQGYGFFFFQYFEQERRGYGIWEVPDDFALPSLEKVSECNSERVLFQHREIRMIPFSERWDHGFVLLQSEDFSACSSQGER